MSAMLSLFLGMTPIAAGSPRPAVEAPLWLIRHWQIGPASSPLCTDLRVAREADGAISGDFSGNVAPLGGRWRWTITGDATPLLRTEAEAGDTARYHALPSLPDRIAFVRSDETDLQRISFVRDDDAIRVEFASSDGNGSTYRYRRASAPCDAAPPPLRFAPVPNP